MPKLSGNKGEWSEIYVLFRLLEIGKLFAADADLNKMDGIFYNIINIIRSENIGNLSFEINSTENTISIIKTDTQDTLLTVDRSKFKDAADKLYIEIINSQTSSFSVDEIEEFLNKIFINTLKAKSTDKADIRMKIHDINSGIESVQGFSVKSRLGSASTLINAGKTTNFLYEVVGNINDSVADGFNTCSKKFKDKFEYLQSQDCRLNFVKVDNGIFESNLLLLDGSLPEICAYMLIDYYSNGVNKIDISLRNISEKNPLNFNLVNGQPFYEYKFKKLLTECALGMLPSTPWNGKADATGGYIIVREDGEVLCYHLFNRNEFENYLLKNTKFETASTSRHQFGDIYKENGKYFIKLNLQVRFIK